MNLKSTTALESVRQMGGQVVRTYVISVYREGSDMGQTVHVLAPGKFNEEGFVALDKVLAVANKKGIRLIVPFFDRAPWMGGQPQYAGFRGREPADFWTDPEIIADFKQTVEHVVNRKNTITGVAYKDDKAILAWETGNEIDATPEWTHEIATVRQAARSEPPRRRRPIAARRSTVAGPRRSEHRRARDAPLPAGPSDFVPDPRGARHDQGQEAVLRRRVRLRRDAPHPPRVRRHDRRRHRRRAPLEPAVPRPRRRLLLAHGSRHRRKLLQGLPLARFLLRRGLRRESRPRPDARKRLRDSGPPAATDRASSPPRLLPIESPAEISWQGSTGAASYDVQRADSPDGPWTTIGKDVSDADVQYRPLFSDDSAAVGRAYYYRVTARNSAGHSAPSNTIGPVTATHRTLVDECVDLTKLAGHEGDVSLHSDNVRAPRKILTGSHWRRVRQSIIASTPRSRPGAACTPSPSRPIRS